MKDLLWLDTVSRVFYLFARHEKLWRVMCFRRFRGNFRFKRTWRFTALLPPERDPRPEEYPADLRMEHFVSELFYRQWYLGHCDKSAFDITISHIEKRAGLTYEEFDQKYLKVGRPVVITDAAMHWTAAQWTPDSMLEKYGDCAFKVRVAPWCVQFPLTL